MRFLLFERHGEAFVEILQKKALLPPMSLCKKSRQHASGRSKVQEVGFTLIELLVVVSIIAVLAVLVVPAVSGALAKSNDTKCLHNLRQLYAGFRLYGADNDGNLPYDQQKHDIAGASIGGSAWHTLVFQYIYPQADDAALLEAFSEWGDTNNLAVNRKKYSVFYCPADPDPRSGKLSYGANYFLKTRKIFSIPGDVILLADTHPAKDGDLAPYELREADMNEQGSKRHSGDHDHFLFADGHVESRVWPKHSTNNAIWDPSK